MGNRLSKIYTRTGDDGSSGMADGSRLPKNHPVFVAMGDIDELNSHIGLVLHHLNDTHAHQQVAKELNIISHLLFNFGGELAMPEFTGIKDEHIAWLEQRIDAMNEHLPYLKDFILPKGSTLISHTHVARCVARRAERSCISLHQHTAISTHLLKFINRLSDYLFVLSRHLTDDNTLNETLWNAQILSVFE